MNLIAVILIFLASKGIKSKHHFIRKLVTNEAYLKMLIIVGALKWYDLPHLHNPIIHFKINLLEKV